VGAIIAVRNVHTKDKKNGTRKIKTVLSPKPPTGKRRTEIQLTDGARDTDLKI
jgi:hypothetical protein